MMISFHSTISQGYTILLVWFVVSPEQPSKCIMVGGSVLAGPDMLVRTKVPVVVVVCIVYHPPTHPPTVRIRSRAVVHPMRPASTCWWWITTTTITTTTITTTMTSNVCHDATKSLTIMTMQQQQQNACRRRRRRRRRCKIPNNDDDGGERGGNNGVVSVPPFPGSAVRLVRVMGLLLSVWTMHAPLAALAVAAAASAGSSSSSSSSSSNRRPCRRSSRGSTLPILAAIFGLGSQSPPQSPQSPPPQSPPKLPFSLSRLDQDAKGSTGTVRVSQPPPPPPPPLSRLTDSTTTAAAATTTTTTTAHEDSSTTQRGAQFRSDSSDQRRRMETNRTHSPPQQQQQQQQQQPLAPPLPPGGNRVKETNKVVRGPPTKDARLPPPPPLPPLGGNPPPQQPYASAVPPPFDSAYYPPSLPSSLPDEYYYYNQKDPNHHHMLFWLQQQLDDSLQRQHEWQHRAHNVTRALATLQQRNELHLRQVEVLTERVMAVEATAAAEHLHYLEALANGTALAQHVVVLKKEVEEWQQKCHDYLRAKEELETELHRVKKEWRSSLLQTEDLAALIERHRLRAELRHDDGDDDEEEEEEEDNNYDEDNNDNDEDNNNKARRRRRRRRTIKHRKKKKRGFWAWLFGWGDDDNEVNRHNQDDLQDVYEQARATLLQALQTERNNVHELEGIVTSLQENNSAISEQVQSRDVIIDELNDRIAVFEEDKLVLKAALRQLQKEMKEEAPKTQQLHQKLEAAQKMIARLQTNIKDLIAQHQSEIKGLQEVVRLKQETIKTTESNLTMIATYVDRLENRLADFAVKRRDIDLREKKCAEMEQTAANMTKLRDALQKQIETYEAERAELKSLLQEMAEERNKFKAQQMKLVHESTELKQNKTKLENSLTSLQQDYHSLQAANMELQAKAKALETQVNTSTASADAVRLDLNRTKAELTNIQRLLEDVQRERSEVLQKLEEAETSSRDLREKLVKMETEAAERQAQVEAESFKKIKANEFGQKREAEMAQKMEELESAALAKIAKMEIEAAEKITKMEKEAHERLKELEAQAKKYLSANVRNFETLPFDCSRFFFCLVSLYLLTGGTYDRLTAKGHRNSHDWSQTEYSHVKVCACNFVEGCTR